MSLKAMVFIDGAWLYRKRTSIFAKLGAENGCEIDYAKLPRVFCEDVANHLDEDVGLVRTNYFGTIPSARSSFSSSKQRSFYDFLEKSCGYEMEIHEVDVGGEGGHDETWIKMALGAGTLLDAPTAALYIQTGADFLVSPCCVDEVITLANRRGIPYSPGCGTVTEIQHAQERGCDLIKIFPAGTVGGPAFVKNVLAPLPWTMLMCTGAVEPTQENLSAWAKSGVTAVGMGSKLFPKEVLAAGDWQAVSDLCRNCLEWFKK